MVSTANIKSHTLPHIPGYIVTEQLYIGSRTAVYRAVQTTQQRSVVIKLLRQEYPSFSQLVQFRNQYTITKNLPIPGIVCPLNLEPWHNSYALVMEDFGDISLQQYAQENSLSLLDTLTIAVQLAAILHDLYQNRVIHKDIKPANILIHPESKQVKLIDFSIASLLPKENQEIQNPNVLEGTLAYLAPEQTGRMNRGIDYRTDFYSLGVTLYELLTGQLPFSSQDPLELVHCHIAKQPKPPHQINSTIPPVVSAIVLKLMAKNAEDRYQSALGLKYDFKKCLAQYKETEAISEFTLGTRDICDRFLIPEKLYGREEQVQILLDAFERVARGKAEMMLVAGFSGIGKTAVVNEVHKPITRQQGYFIRGKFDQFNRNIPFSAFVQAFRSLMGQLLGESDVDLVHWKTRILEAVGENGQVIIDVIPELESIIGKQTPVPELAGGAAQNRFNLILGKFVRVFATQEHPLVIFLDDLQWADSASLNLLKLLMGDSQAGYLLVLGAYRDNEVFPAHPLMLTLDEIAKQGANLDTITLSPLTEEDITCLVADTLLCTPEIALPLSQLVYQKTQGNPFFTTQFLQGLHEDGCIKFASDAGYWQCNLAQVRQLALTDDVVGFMVRRLQKLPQATQEVLKLAACIGNRFDLATLVIVCNRNLEETAADLWKGLQEGFVIPESETYKFFQDYENCHRDTKDVAVSYRFLHDRVQQAAYSLIPEAQKKATHLKIGRQLWHNLPESELENHLFTIVNHLNTEHELITEPSERYDIAKLNLQASQKAKASIAYEASRCYCHTGLLFLEQTSWEKAYSLHFALAIAMIEAEYLNHNLQAAQALSQDTLTKARTLLDRIKVHELQILFEINQNKMNEAIALAIDVLSLLDVNIPTEPQQVQAEIEFLRQEIALPTAQIANLATLEAVKDEEKLAAIRILTNASSAAYIANPTLYPAIILQTVRHCMQYGNSPLAASAYSWCGALLCGVYGEFEAGYEFGKLSVQLLDKFNARTLASKVSNMFNVFVRPWKEHLQNTIVALPEAIQSGFDNGDIEYAFYAAVHYCSYLLYRGVPLDEVRKYQQKYLPVIIQAKYEFHEGFLRINQQVVANLVGETEQPQFLNGSILDGASFLSQCLDNNILFLVLCFYEAQTRLSYLFGDYIGAKEAGEKGWQYRQAAMGTLYASEHNFYYSLALLANQKITDQDLNRLTSNQRQLKIWAKFSPANFQHKYDLIEAESHRLRGEKIEAIELYDQAISGAKAHKFTQEEALANELAGKFYLNWGKEKIASSYMQEAYYCYARWGAQAKIDDLEKLYPNLLSPILQQAKPNLNILDTLTTLTNSNPSLQNTTTITTSSRQGINSTLDFAAILKASQSLSSTIQLNELLRQLTQIILQNSGGDSCILILPNSQEKWCVEAIATYEKTKITSDDIEDNPNLPVKLIQYVKHTKEVVVIDEMKTDLPVIDKYLSEQQPKSVLCLPLLNQGKLIGILYLRNRLTIGVFTQERILILNFLCSQAAISLENARLYQESIANQKQLKQSQTKLIAHQSTLRAILDNAPIWIWMTDIRGKMLLVNKTFCDDVGINEKAFISAAHYRYILGEEVAQKSIKSDLGCLAQDAPYYSKELIPFVDGKKHSLETVKTKVKDKDSQTIGIVALGIDVTERERMESEIQEKNYSLETALQELQQAQLQMVQNEKMASLGNLVAGVAHEINNPLGFLNGSINNINDYLQDLLEHLELYQQNYADAVEEIQEHSEDIDLGFVCEDLPKLLKAMQGATNRIKNISTSLRTFSRADTDHKVSANIHDGINSTLLILKYRLKANENRPAIEVIQDYGELPEIECFPGQLNQVFMNILANAIDVFDEEAQNHSFTDLEANSQKITIKTAVNSKENTVEICIRDNGKGMEEKVKLRIFDHLFTTKGVDKGTGLGLAIARQIVNETHSGSLEVYSELGQGTEFCVRLPMGAKT